MKMLCDGRVWVVVTAPPRTYIAAYIRQSTNSENSLVSEALK